MFSKIRAAGQGLNGMKIVDSKNLERELNERWYESGQIDSAMDVLQFAKKTHIEFSESGSKTAERVEGAWRVKHDGFCIPQRLAEATYLPEPGRIMYAVHSTPVYNSNGYSTRTRGVAEGIVEAGGDVVVVARSGYPWDSATDGNKPNQRRIETRIGDVTYIHTPGGNLNRQGLDRYVEQCADSFVREARRLRPSVVMAASNHRTALPALIAARRLGIPFVYEIRGFWEVTETVKKPQFKGTERYTLQQQLETLVAQEADTVLAITRQVAENMVARGVDEEKIVVAPNAVDTDRFVPIPKDSGYAKRIKADPDKVTIGFAGSIVGYEGLDTLLKATELLNARGIDHQVVIAGSGAEEAELKEQASLLGLQNVVFTGRLPQKEMPRLLSTFDIIVCPRKSYEITELVSPLKPLEAFSAGRATVLSGVAPNVDLAGPDQGRAALFAAGDENALADRLEEIITDEDRRRALSRAGRLWVVKNRRWENIGQTILQSSYDAVRSHASTAHSGVPLNNVTVGLIADEFTTESLRGSVKVVPLHRTSWQEQLANDDINIVFVESAWEGNEGEWHRGVGYYSDEEASDLYALLSYAKEHGIPTIFWNKEDPVHFNRFAPTAIKFDHVFTTDANMIPRYRGIEGGRMKTVAALPFWAQPTIHNPLPETGEFHDTFSHAGTYYGERYEERSADLVKLLSVAEEFGVEIYDRQAENPDSPYKFPPQYQQYVKGALPYEAVVGSYKNHTAHLNVNSVKNSPTMFSRRVVEIPACGGVVLSAAGRGIEESLGPTIAHTNDPETMGALLYAWHSDETQRKREIWRQMRTIFRSFTASSALQIALRTAGLSVSEPNRAAYAVKISRLTQEALTDLARQSYLPSAIFAEEVDEDLELATLPSVTVTSDEAEASSKAVYFSDYREGLGRTFYEDLLVGTQFGKWETIGLGVSSPHYIASANSEDLQDEVLRRVDGQGAGTLVLELVDADAPEERPEVADTDVPALAPGTTILVAGHDLKFARQFMEELEKQDVTVLVDQWENHTKHDEDASRELLESADVVFCEWGLGNIRWYSRNVKPHQRLVVRVHLQEIFRPYLTQTMHENVDAYIFVGKLIRDTAVLSHGVPGRKAVVIGNSVDVDALSKPKTDDARYTLGFVGTVPQRKRVDLALDLLEKLRETDERYKLRIKGKTWLDYPWLQNRPEEVEYYEEIDRRIAAINAANPGTIVLDPFGDDMDEWYRNVGIVLSTSDFESFHLTIADGAASGAMPAVLGWAGADFIYPPEWLSGTVEELADRIRAWDGDGEPFQDFLRQEFRRDDVTSALMSTLIDEANVG